MGKKYSLMDSAIDNSTIYPNISWDMFLKKSQKG